MYVAVSDRGGSTSCAACCLTTSFNCTVKYGVSDNLVRSQYALLAVVGKLDRQKARTDAGSYADVNAAFLSLAPE